MCWWRGTDDAQPASRPGAILFRGAAGARVARPEEAGSSGRTRTIRARPSQRSQRAVAGPVLLTLAPSRVALARTGGRQLTGLPAGSTSGARSGGRPSTSALAPLPARVKNRRRRERRDFQSAARESPSVLISVWRAMDPRAIFAVTLLLSGLAASNSGHSTSGEVWQEVEGVSARRAERVREHTAVQLRLINQNGEEGDRRRLHGTEQYPELAGRNFRTGCHPPDR